MKKLRSRDIVFRKPLIFHVSENTKNDLKHRIYWPDVDPSKYTLYASTYIYNYKWTITHTNTRYEPYNNAHLFLCLLPSLPLLSISFHSIRPYSITNSYFHRGLALFIFLVYFASSPSAPAKNKFEEPKFSQTLRNEPCTKLSVLH